MKEITKEAGYGEYRKTYHYEFVKEYPYINLYRCKETGHLECFKK